MVRVAQMFFFKVLMDVVARHHPALAGPDAHLRLLDHFLDFPDRAFSLHAFLRARLAEGGSVDVGDFWRAPQAIHSFLALWGQLDGLPLGVPGPHGVRPALPVSGLVFCDWRDGIINKKKLYKKLMKWAVCPCASPTRNADLKFLSFKPRYAARCLRCMWAGRSVLVTLHFSLGLSKPQPGMLLFLDALLATPGCVGGFVGSRSFAYYLLGSTAAHYLFLDPHFVQPLVKSPADPAVASYRLHSVKEIAKSDVSPCVSLGFLLHSEPDFRDFWAALKALRAAFPEDFYFDLTEEGVLGSL